MKYYGGIDLGGTKIYSIVIDEKGNVLSRAKIKTGGKKDFKEVLNKIFDCFNEAVEKSSVNLNDILSIGMAVPSAVDITRGLLKHAPNLDWENVEIAKYFIEKYQKPFYLDNDVNMGTFGEYCFSKVINYQSIYGIFVGTGIGGGYIVNGEIVHGKNFTAGEFGHMIIELGGQKCNCGNKGCLEAIAGKVGIIHYLKRQVDKKGKSTELDNISPDWRTTIGSSALKKAYNRKDKLVTKAIHRSANAIGIAAANLVNVIGVEAMILGGGVIEELGDVYLPIIRKTMAECSIADGAAGVEVVPSHLGDDAVALGAAWFTSLEEKQSYLLK
ncbi:MAG: ROK family protein [Spirochaetes bacterium]|nr:ROK family protein [Spirochaetota bacterium]